MAINQHAVARTPAQELVERHTGHFAKNIPERDINRRDGGHGHRAASPISAAIKELPEILDPPGVAADQIGDDMVGQIGRHRELAAIEGRIAQTIDARTGFDAQRYKVTRRAGHDDTRVDDFPLARGPF